MRIMNFRLRTLFAVTLIVAVVLAVPAMTHQFGLAAVVIASVGFYFACVVALGRWRR
jgi:hypothetical protein